MLKLFTPRDHSTQTPGHHVNADGGTRLSVKAINWALELPIPPTPKLIMVVLSDYADENGYSFPGMDKIARRASISERTAIRYLNELEEKGLLTRERRTIETGHRTSNGYRLNAGAKVTDWHLDNVTDEADKVTAVASTEEPPVEPPVTATARKRATPLPMGMTWSNAHSMKAAAKGVDVEVEFGKFQDYHLARGSTFVDWDRAFHTWLNNARPEIGRGSQEPVMRPSRDQEIRAVLQGSLGLDEQKEIAR